MFDVVMTRQEMADYLKISLSKLDHMVQRDEIPYMRIGGPGASVRFDLDDVRRWAYDGRLTIPAQEPAK